MTFPETTIGPCRILHADCVKALALEPANSFDACVTDPPYGLAFMGKTFDKLGTGQAMQDWHQAWAVEVLRVLKPGAFCLAFGGDRTIHRLICALEDAGFEIRGQIAWLHAMGFPKSLDVSKALGHAAGAEREVLEEGPCAARRPHSDHTRQGITFADDAYVRPSGHVLTAPATDEARQWAGYGTALKPAMELIVMARKPLQGTVVENVLRWGTGVLNIDATRIPCTKESPSGSGHRDSWRLMEGREDRQAWNGGNTTPSLGRWPANVLLEDTPEVTSMFPHTSKSVPSEHPDGRRNNGNSLFLDGFRDASNSSSDPGSASRFFFTAKASPSERGAGNNHPTVKPVSLIRWLLRLVCPPTSICLDPFAGSGTTGIASYEEGRQCVLIEKEAEYYALACQRLNEATKQQQLFALTSEDVTP